MLLPSLSAPWRRALAALACGLVLAGPAATREPAIPDLGPVVAAPVASALPAGWAQRGVFMEILVRAYQDSDGDGIGDLAGLTQRLDYLQQLGVRGIWLMPIFKSEDRDHGYAVVNYREIEPDYGTLADFDRFLVEAHRRGIAVILDYVMNHAGSAHPLFESAYDSRKSPFNDWFIWAEDKPKGWNTFAGDPWREGNQRWYYAVFDAGMPDFNLRNPKVVDFHLDNLRYWLNRGVDGFRFDAVGVLFENSAIAWENQPENHQLLRRVQELLASYGNKYLVCESPSDPAPFAEADSCGGAFAFGLQKHILSSVKLGRLRDDVLYTLRKMPMPRMATLLANHDHFAGARLMKQFDGDERSYRLAAATLLTLPGTPFLYYGEEIGLGLSTPVANADQSLRGPMSWSAERNAGFTRADKPFRPSVANWQTHNVAAQQADPGSLLNWYRGLVALRNAEPALSIGSFTPLSERDMPVFAFTREHAGARLLVLINYAYREATHELPSSFAAQQWSVAFPPGAASPFVGPAKGAKASAGKATTPVRLAPQQVLILKAR
ncbi:alpha-amylase family glycosyl hydrolase [uncultured Piscinibacter sp.]|uniref:alpha-amylase family glycosyl hydrolase n=1 Tax=uncultured Piscinibacter sp. TaxID=1131835 RepID=UPI002639DDBE|nr:alpha-amylase family glycosyl hydrolase [uncultured Piscinibacter sp.]